MLASCSVCASLFANYTAVIATFLAFRYSCLVPPFLHCCHDFRFSFTALSTSLLQHQTISSHISSAASRSSFFTYSQVLSTSAGICWHFIDTACLNSFCTTLSFNFQVFILRGIRMGLTGFADTTESQTVICVLWCTLHCWSLSYPWCSSVVLS